MPSRLPVLAIALLAAMLLAGCATPREPAAVLPRAQAEQQLALLADFAFEGRAALRQAEKGTQASLAWVQRGEDARLRLSGPFGAGALRVELEGDLLTMEDSRGTRLSGPDAEAALVEQVGFVPPLASLRWWLLGLPAPGHEAQLQRDEAGLPARLSQQGWQVEYQEFREELLGPGKTAMPRRMRATREALDLRLVIDRWDLAP